MSNGEKNREKVYFFSEYFGRWLVWVAFDSSSLKIMANDEFDFQSTKNHVIDSYRTKYERDVPLLGQKKKNLYRILQNSKWRVQFRVRHKVVRIEGRQLKSTGYP